MTKLWCGNMAGKKPEKKKGLSKEEIAAMKEHMQELNGGKADGGSAVLEKIAEMPEPDRTLGKRIHSLILSSVPSLSPRTWYGMPAYYKGDKLICFFQNASKFKARYATLGFSDKANLDEGDMWPTSFAVNKLTLAEEKRIAALVKKAVGWG